MSRHDTQASLPEIGEKGQQRIEDAHILIVGVGALGSVAAELLCRAGVRNITLCDYDIVQESNLQRQSLYTTDDVGRLKVEAAKEHLIAIDPMCLVTPVAEPFSSATPLSGVDLIIDGTDSLNARLLLNDAAKKSGIPLVIGAAGGTRGIIFAVAAGDPASTGAPCWQCIARSKSAGSDCDSGVLGMTTHAIASLQAAAALRILLGDTPRELVEIDVWTLEARKVRVRQNPACAACKGVYEHLDAPFHLHVCRAKQQLQARPNKPYIVDFERVKSVEHVEKAYGSALLVKLGNGTALIHRFGTMEFKDVDEETARRFALWVMREKVEQKADKNKDKDV
jgi:adenylyltransferase/sulfurtransferase